MLIILQTFLLIYKYSSPIINSSLLASEQQLPDVKVLLATWASRLSRTHLACLVLELPIDDYIYPTTLSCVDNFVVLYSALLHLLPTFEHFLIFNRLQ